VRESFKRQILAITLILFLDQLIRAYSVQGLTFLTGDNLGLHVSILPYLCYFIFGMMAYKAYKRDNFNRYDNQILLVYGVLFFLLNVAVYLAFPYPFVSEYRGYLPMLLMVASLLILLVLVLVRLVELDGNVKTWLGPVENLGRISFTGYYISYTSFIILGTFQFSQPLIANLLIFFSTALGLVVLEWLWRPEYRYGFEWFYRKISSRALHYTQRYLRR
jgi:hypothetical protein